MSKVIPASFIVAADWVEFLSITSSSFPVNLWTKRSRAIASLGLYVLVINWWMGSVIIQIQNVSSNHLENIQAIEVCYWAKYDIIVYCLLRWGKLLFFHEEFCLSLPSGWMVFSCRSGLIGGDKPDTNNHLLLWFFRILQLQQVLEVKMVDPFVLNHITVLNVNIVTTHM